MLFVMLHLCWNTFSFLFFRHFCTNKLKQCRINLVHSGKMCVSLFCVFPYFSFYLQEYANQGKAAQVYFTE